MTADAVEGDERACLHASYERALRRLEEWEGRHEETPRAVPVSVTSAQALADAEPPGERKEMLQAKLQRKRTQYSEEQLAQARARRDEKEAPMSPTEALEK